MPNNRKQRMTRREMLSSSLLAGGALLLGADSLAACLRDGDTRRTFLQAAEGPFAGGTQIGAVEFVGEPKPIMDAPFNSELDGREYTDFSGLTSSNAITPTDKFYIRTRASKLLDLSKPWTIQVGPASDAAGGLAAQEIVRSTEPMGVHLMECSGNAPSAHFGMLSTADWSGMPITKLAARLKI